MRIDCGGGWLALDLNTWICTLGVGLDLGLVWIRISAYHDQAICWVKFSGFYLGKSYLLGNSLAVVGRPSEVCRLVLMRVLRGLSVVLLVV